jgi:transcription-repair coupling factor (superfamily II helicase)
MERLYQKFISLQKTTQFLEAIKNKYRLVREQEPLMSVTGLAGAKSLLALVLYRTFNQNIIYLAKDSETKTHIHSDLLSFLPEENLIMFSDTESAEVESFNLFTTKSNFIIILQPEDLEIEIPNADQWTKYRFSLAKDAVLPIENLVTWLDSAQYERLDLVSEPGEYAVRGSIVDIFPPKCQNPIRIEFIDNQIISLRYFDTITQRSISFINSIEIFAQGRADVVKNTMRDLLPKDTFVVSEVLNLSRPSISQNGYNDTMTREIKEGRDKYFTNLILVNGEPADFNFGFHAPPIYLANFPLLKSEIETSPIDYFFVTLHEYQYERLTHIFGNKPTYLIGSLASGIFAPDDGFCVITEKELYGAPVMRLPKRKFKGQPLDDLLALNKGDYVVHIDYGIGQFDDVVRIKVDPAPISGLDDKYNLNFNGKQDSLENRCGIEKDFLLIRYAGAQKLYVPVENLGLIERYIGGEAEPPTLSRLGTQHWLLTKVKVARATEAYAQELLNIYAERSIAKKMVYDKDSDWQEEFEASFPYEETADQIKALVDVKKDLESVKPMDRLICGDTGFGKTEIALRAAFKVVTGLKQVAVLVPTTILCYQHFHTFRKRFENFPVRVEMLSRFTPRANRQKIIADLKQGKVDIVIGTHTLISPKIEFKDLGLLVIDEEHKFGVKQKEQIKKLKSTLDVLTLTATPIPRTLYRSLVGLADITPIHTPPLGRHDIVTSVVYWDDEIIFKRISDELVRGGQILFIHNRINSIKNITKRLVNLNRNWRIAVVHSKLPEKFLADVYLDFLDRKYDILVSTAIIESGLDMPNVNTIFINRADQFGLSDLHQLRGRVGRSDRQAYAIFILPTDKDLKTSDDKDQANLYEKRLSTILAYSKIGAGFRLAMRDMELRGVGNILGTEQHGYVAQVGLNLYQQMLKDAIGQIRGETIKPEPILSLDIPAYIPEDYIPDSYERVAIYKRMLSLESELELNSIAEELQDRFGKYPGVIEDLFAIARIRLKARDLNILKISFKNNVITIVRANKTLTFNGNLTTLQKILTKQIIANSN